MSDAECLGAELMGIMFLWMDVFWSPGLERNGEDGSLERHKQLEPQCWVLTEVQAMSVVKKQHAGVFIPFPLQVIFHFKPFLPSLTHCWYFRGPQRMSDSVHKNLKSRKMTEWHSWNVNPFANRAAKLDLQGSRHSPALTLHVIFTPTIAVTFPYFQ